MVATISQWGNSGGIRVPKSILTSLKIAIGDKVKIFIDGNKAVIEPIQEKEKISLNELVSNIPKNYKPTEEFNSQQGLEKW